MIPVFNTDTGQEIQLPHVLLEDSRNQVGKHRNIKEFCDLVGIRIVRTKIVCGDYTLPTNQSICIDTKYGLQEVYGNLVQDHERFRRECVLAGELGIRLVVLVEEDGIRALDEVFMWKNPRYERYMFLKRGHEAGRFLGTKLPRQAPIDSARLQTMMETMSQKYGVEWQFCRKSETGFRICEILMGGANDL
jgi:hypothetical protein